MDNVEDQNFSKEHQQSSPKDWFASLPSVQDTKRRLYNPNLRTPEAQAVWDKLPGFLQDNKDLLLTKMGAKDAVVHLHGSTLLGVSTDGKRKEESPYIWELQPSDVDLVVFVDDSNLSVHEGDTKVFQFVMESGMEDVLGRQGEGVLVSKANLERQLKSVCQKTLTGDELTFEENSGLYFMTSFFGSDALFESSHGKEAQWRNELLKTILDTPGGEDVWNTKIREMFNTYVVNYETNSFGSDASGHENRVARAFDKIASAKEKPDEIKRLAADYLRDRRASIQLPPFEELRSLRPHLV